MWIPVITGRKMVKWFCIDLKAGEAGDNVAVLISMVDRGRGDPRNILGVIVDWDEHNMYRIAVKAEILSIKYFKNQFDLSLQQLLNDSDVNTECTSTLCQARKSTTSGKQAFFRCDCNKSKNKCQTNKCKCYKPKRLCNSKCQTSLSCQNKN